MPEAIASLGGFEIMRIAIKAAGYGSALLAAGLVLFFTVHRDIPVLIDRSARQFALVAALVALTLVGGKVLAESAFLGGGEWQAATNLELLGVVIGTPIGDAAVVRAIGLVVIASLVFGTTVRWPAALGALAVVASFAMVGHTLREPRLVLGSLIMVHAAGIAYWIGAFWPLYRATEELPPPEAGRLATAFGRFALWGVAALVAAGALLFILLTADPLAALRSSYGLLMLAKLVFTGALLGLAAMNKLVLSPALANGDATAVWKFRLSIGTEACLVILVLVAVAAMTTLGGLGR